MQSTNNKVDATTMIPSNRRPAEISDEMDAAKALMGVGVDKGTGALMDAKASSNKDLITTSDKVAPADSDAPDNSPKAAKKRRKRNKKGERELASIDGTTLSGRGKRAKKPADMPKRPLSAYNIFFKEKRARLLEGDTTDQDRLPEIPHGKMGFEMLAKTIGKMWKALPEARLEHYKALAEADMDRYKAEMSEYHLNLAKKRKLHAETVAAAAVPEPDKAASHPLSKSVASKGDGHAMEALLREHQNQDEDQRRPNDEAAAIEALVQRRLQLQNHKAIENMLREQQQQQQTQHSQSNLAAVEALLRARQGQESQFQQHQQGGHAAAIEAILKHHQQQEEERRQKTNHQATIEALLQQQQQQQQHGQQQRRQQEQSTALQALLKSQQSQSSNHAAAIESLLRGQGAVDQQTNQPQTQRANTSGTSVSGTPAPDGGASAAPKSVESLLQRANALCSTDQSVLLALSSAEQKFKVGGMKASSEALLQLAAALTASAEKQKAEYAAARQREITAFVARAPPVTHRLPPQQQQQQQQTDIASLMRQLQAHQQQQDFAAILARQLGHSQGQEQARDLVRRFGL